MTRRVGKDNHSAGGPEEDLLELAATLPNEGHSCLETGPRIALPSRGTKLRGILENQLFLCYPDGWG